MNFLPSSSLFLGLSSTASVRRPHRETWQNVEGTELDDVCGRLRHVSSTGAAVSSDAAEPFSNEDTCGATAAVTAAAEAGESVRPVAAGCSRDSPPHKSYSSVLRLQHGLPQERGEAEPPHAASPAPCREAESAAGGSGCSVNSTARVPPSIANASPTTDRSLPRYGSVSSMRRASSGFSTSLPTAPYEQLLFQRQQQRRLMQQQATLMSFPSVSSSCGSSEVLSAALDERRQKEEQSQQQKNQMQQQEDVLQKTKQHDGGLEEAKHSPSRCSVMAELKGPSLRPALRLQLLHEVMWSTASTPNSSLGRSERKWWSMDERNLEAFIFSHHRTFLRRLGR